MARRRGSATPAGGPAKPLTRRERELLRELDNVALKWLRLARATGEPQALAIGRITAAALAIGVQRAPDEVARASEWARGVLGEKGTRALGAEADAKRMGLSVASIRESFRIGWDFKGARRTSSAAIDRLLFATHALVRAGESEEYLPTLLAFKTLETFPFLKDRGPNQNTDLPERIARAIERDGVEIAGDEDSVRALVKIALVAAGMPDVTAAMKFLAVRDKADLHERERLAKRREAKRKVR